MRSQIPSSGSKRDFSPLAVEKSEKWLCRRRSRPYSAAAATATPEAAADGRTAVSGEVAVGGAGEAGAARDFHSAESRRLV